jgi:hypothetical protein
VEHKHAANGHRRLQKLLRVSVVQVLVAAGGCSKSIRRSIDFWIQTAGVLLRLEMNQSRSILKQ